MRGVVTVDGHSIGRVAAVALAVAAKSPPVPFVTPFGEVSARVSMAPSLLHKVVDALKPELPRPRTDADRWRMSRAQMKQNRKDAARAARNR